MKMSKSLGMPKVQSKVLLKSFVKKKYQSIKRSKKPSLFFNLMYFYQYPTDTENFQSYFPSLSLSLLFNYSIASVFNPAARRRHLFST